MFDLQILLFYTKAWSKYKLEKEKAWPPEFPEL